VASNTREIDPGGELLRRIEDEAHLPAGVAARAALFSTISALRQRLSLGEADRLLEALPVGIQHLVAGYRRRHGEHPEVFDKDELVARVAGELAILPEDTEPFIGDVFRLVQAHLPDEAIAHVASQLPPDLRDLWSPRGSESEARAEAGSNERTLGQEVALTRRVLRAVRASGALPPAVSERAAIVSVLSVLAERLSTGAAEALFASLPAGIHPLVDGVFRGPAKHGEGFGREAFLERVANRLGVPFVQAEGITHAVFAAAASALPLHIVHATASELSAELRDLWLGASSLAGVPAPA
jgi:uncharacterized protein (DUF2267 family)